MEVARISLRNMDENIVFLIPLDLMRWIENKSLEAINSGKKIKVTLPDELIQELEDLWPSNGNFVAQFDMSATAVNDAMLHISTQVEYVDDEDESELYEKAMINFIIMEDYDGLIY